MKTSRIIPILISFLTYLNIYAQTPIDILDNKIKIYSVSEEFIYCGFHEGDQIIINFEEINGKELKEFEIIELPTTTIFKDYKIISLLNKIITVPRTGIYKFRFYNSSISSRVCKFKLQRIPLNLQSIQFNTNVYWKTVSDTTYNIVKEQVLVKLDTVIHNITDNVVMVNSSSNLSGNRSSFNFILPNNTVSWSYYVGVNQEGQIAYKAAIKKLQESNSTINLISGYGPLAALALGGASFLSQLESGEDITYFIVDGDNINLFLSGMQFRYYKTGKVINDFSKMTTPLTGNLHFGLMNDNVMTGVSVSVKITAIQVNQVYENKDVRKMNVVTKQEPYLKN